jgi:hypothetical protein
MKRLPKPFDDYFITECGEVWSAKRSDMRKLKQVIEGRGAHQRLKVTLSVGGVSKTFKAHHLVLEAFGEPRPSTSHVCRHLDGDGTNNHISNLEWGTVEENAADAKLHGSHIKGAPRGEEHHSASLTEADVIEIRSLARHGVSDACLAEKYGVGISTIGQARSGTTWSHLPNAYKLNSRRDGFTKEALAEAKHLRAQGLSYQKIADRLGFSKYAVRHNLLKS